MLIDIKNRLVEEGEEYECTYEPELVSVLGVSGINIVTRIMGIILASIAFGMLTSGLKALLPGLA